MTELLSQEEINEISKICDAWHVHGDPQLHGNRPEVDEFVGVLKYKLPRVKLPIDIGGTGYPLLTCKVEEIICQNGWCLDKGRRFVAFIDGYLLFRRYTAGGDIMYGKLDSSANDLLFPSQYSKFLEKL